MSTIRMLSIVAVVAAVIALGLFVYVTDAPAYAGKNPATCNNCHVMDAAYENWFHGGHETVTVCVDCHLPHDNFVHYYYEKARTGLHDVYTFSSGGTPLLIRAKPETQQIIQNNCIRCHTDTVDGLLAWPQGQAFDRHCWECHRTAAHAARGISIAPRQDADLYPVK